MRFSLFAAVTLILTFGAAAAPDRNFQECPECSQMVAIPAGKIPDGQPGA